MVASLCNDVRVLGCAAEIDDHLTGGAIWPLDSLRK